MGRRVSWTNHIVRGLLICLIFFSIKTASANQFSIKTAANTSPPSDTPPVTPVPNAAGQTTLTQSTPFAESELTLTAGIRNDDLEWSIAGNGVDVLSELSWTDVDSYQISVANQTRLKNNLYFRIQFNYASFMDGKVRDSDYGGNGKTAEWSRSISESSGDQLWDFSTGGGFAFFFLQKRLMISPLLGISYHQQNLRIQNGAQVVSESNPFGRSDPPAIGPLSSQLNSSYFARWAGPWIGCDLRYAQKVQPASHHNLEFRFSMELHLADYYGEGNWNLRGDLVHPKSFEHETDGYGISLTGQCLIHIGRHWDITFTATHQDWSTDSGTDRKFLVSGGTAATKLNGVDWNSTSLMAGAVYHF
jgi:hypothetical protein